MVQVAVMVFEKLVAFVTTTLPQPQQSVFGQYCSQILNWLVSNPFFQQNQIALMFGFSIIPSIFLPIPRTELMIPLLTNGADASGIVIAATAGNVLGQVFLYYLAKHGFGYLKRKELKKDKEIKHFLHKYSYLIFLIAPFGFIGGDFLVLYAGFSRVKIHQFLIPLIIGFTIKNIVSVIFVLNGITILPRFTQICTS